MKKYRYKYEYIVHSLYVEYVIHNILPKLIESMAYLESLILLLTNGYNLEVKPKNTFSMAETLKII